MTYFFHKNTLAIFIAMAAFIFPFIGHAATSTATGLSFLDFLWVIVDYLQGPVITALAVLAIIISALIIMFLDVSKGAKLGVSVVLGISIATTALGLLGSLGITTATF